jgi:hypothetical protein
MISEEATPELPIAFRADAETPELVMTEDAPIESVPLFGFLKNLTIPLDSMPESSALGIRFGVVIVFMACSSSSSISFSVSSESDS